MDTNKRLTGRHFLLLLGAVILGIVLLVALKPEPERELRELSPTQVVVTEVKRDTLMPRVEVTGRLRPARTTALHFQVSGQLAERLAQPGEPVEAGAVLLQLEAGDFADAVIQARSALEQEEASIARDRRLLELSEANVELQQQEVNRLESLGSSLASRSQLGAASQALLQLRSEAARLRFAVETAESRLALRRSELRRAERNLQRTRLVAPFAGTVNVVNAEVGDYITPQQVAAELLDTTTLDLYVEVSADAATVLQRGARLLVHVDGDRREGEVIAVQKDPDPVTYTYAVRIRIPADNTLPGTLARTTVELGERSDVPVIPVTAILREEGESYVYVLSGETLERRKVTLGVREGRRQAVRAGLQPGETIVAQDVAALTEGQRVVTQPVGE